MKRLVSIISLLLVALMMFTIIPVSAEEAGEADVFELS